ncbi:hypothetical protein [Streptomyces sp. URMC 124]|uniref:hypothetical protein n=1 Tax=Streptomyces sp. URMC 124 TaxID=3423405 RepID=UPI003F1E3144
MTAQTLHTLDSKDAMDALDTPDVLEAADLIAQAPFSAEISPATRYASVATLADDPAGLTCSVTVGTRWAATGKASRLFGYPSFEAAADSVKDGRHDALLVAGAYPEIRTFFFDPELRAVEAFVGPLPDMVFAAPPEDASLDRFDVVHYHPATRRLFESRVSGRAAESFHATSNSAACKAALAHGGRAAAITNATCAEHFGLEVIEVLSAGTPMSFVVFERRK